MSQLNVKALVKRATDMISREAAAVTALAGQIDERIADVVRLMLDCTGHVLVTGAGTSRMVAQRFSHLLACCGIPAIFINSADALHGGSGAVKKGDVLYVISKGGKSREINDFVKIARKRGAVVIAHTENEISELTELSDAIYLVKAEGEIDPYGMIATGSSLVNSCACDVLCTLLLDAKGYTKEDFSLTHPEGAVGDKIAENKEKVN